MASNDVLDRPIIEYYTTLFERKCFDFITTKDGKRHEKQNEALCILTDDETEEFAYGGAAGGAKSWTGCVWLVFMCLAFPDTKWFIGREELTRLLSSTYITLQKVLKFYGVAKDSYTYNGQYHYIQFKNGSRIDFLDLKFQPRDPLYERFGSLEYTGGWIEEGGEVNFGAYDTLRTRVGRHNNERYRILAKLFVTLNPKKNWCHQTFWKPFKDGTLPAMVKFLRSLVTDNPFIDEGYINKLNAIKDKVKKQRLLHGNFDYDDDDNALMDYDSITDIFSNHHVATGNKYITTDVARFGEDKSVIMVWDGFRVIEIHVLHKKSTTYVASEVKKLKEKYKVGTSQIVVDDDGVGGGVVDQLGCRGFVNNSSPLPNPKNQNKENYQNLKSQCYYMLAEKVNSKEIYVKCESTEVQDDLIEEMEQVKKKNPDSDKKLAVVSKEEVKALIGRSPDYSDTLMMRMIFELKYQFKVLVA